MTTPPDAKATLHRYLRAARESLLWKLDGLSEYDVRRPLTPTGTNLLGLELQLVDGVYLVIDPADVSMPIPHLTGAPLSYRQYRFTVGLQIGP